MRISPKRSYVDVSWDKAFYALSSPRGPEERELGLMDASLACRSVVFTILFDSQSMLKQDEGVFGEGELMRKQ